MARIKEDTFERINKYKNSIHKHANASYTVFNAGDNMYFQIDTYGSNEREMPEKISQSIQMDSEMAIHLIKTISMELNINLRSLHENH